MNKLPAYNLMPKSLAAKIPALYSQENERDPMVRAKFFALGSSWTWYVIEYRPEERLCFGLVDGFEQELGYFTLDELESLRGPFGLPRVERDLYFTPCKLSDVRKGASA